MSTDPGSQTGWVPAPQQGWVAPHIASEFPGLGIASVAVDAEPGKSPEPIRRASARAVASVSGCSM